MISTSHGFVIDLSAKIYLMVHSSNVSKIIRSNNKSLSLDFLFLFIGNHSTRSSEKLGVKETGIRFCLLNLSYEDVIEKRHFKLGKSGLGHWNKVAEDYDNSSPQ
jgi:hypothetical protein